MEKMADFEIKIPSGLIFLGGNTALNNTIL